MNEGLIRILVVDGDASTRQSLRAMVEGRAGFTVAGEAADGKSAMEKVRSLHPDLVLLDVQLSDMSGFEVVSKVGSEAMPAVVFLASDERSAVASFDANAVDYVLKPVVEERFIIALERARRALEATAMARHFKRVPERFTVRVGDIIRAFRVDEIDWVEADEYYVKLHIGGKAYLIRQTMHALEEVLPADHFVRIHRSTIVNIDRILSFEPMFRGEYTVTLKDGTTLRMSRRRSELLQRLFSSLT